MKSFVIGQFLLFVFLILPFFNLVAQEQSLIPGNDVCSNAYTINCGFSMTGNTNTAIADLSGVTCEVEADAPGIWFKAAPTNGSYAANVCAVTSFDSRILVFQGDCDNLVCVAGNEDWCGEASRVEWAGHPSDWSYIYVTGVGGQTGPIQLQLQCYDCGEVAEYANDACAGATDILDSEVLGNTCCAQPDAPNLCTGAFSTPSGVWYKANSGSYGDLNFQVTNLTGAAVALTIFEDQGGGCNDLEEMACGGPVTGVIAGNLGAIFSLQSNTDYYFFVNVWNTNDCGSFEIRVNGENVAVLGCTDPTACNYNAGATVNDGTCTYPGCQDPIACNYDASAGCAATCSYPEMYLDCAGNCIEDADDDGVCDPLEIPGCTDLAACNFTPTATEDNGTCYYATAVYDCDGSCQVDLNSNGVCDQFEDGTCIGAECCGEDTIWDPIEGRCLGFDDCAADVNGDGEVNAVDILDLIGGYGTVCP